MRPPARIPIGLALSRTAKLTSAAFDDAMTRAGGSLSIWLVLLALKSNKGASQRELAEVVGIQGATLTHHLNGMENAGLVTRRRDPENRRVHIVELTEDGEAMFGRLLLVAKDFDGRLRAGFTEAELDAFTGVLRRLERNVGQPGREPDDCADVE
ncbi:MarR family winged helix-turn-helix transcriptional regulator [Pseudonocardia acaciae]|uniref:MarR family winged helix-turn-helix transcriptional regulator n=1 Tax=Pseudonocardia acaciae TaxID=551276 RepID=UPI00048F8300|nr:MarR family winged helix-turn-helix transcriptional regulator [Pseudonocardia acaciae]